MGETVQLIVVLVIVAAAAIYAGRRVLGQLVRSEDEAAGCSGCALNPAMQDKQRRQAAKDRRRRAKVDRAPDAGEATTGGQVVQLHRRTHS